MIFKKQASISTKELLQTALQLAHDNRVQDSGVLYSFLKEEGFSFKEDYMYLDVSTLYDRFVIKIKLTKADPDYKVIVTFIHSPYMEDPAEFYTYLKIQKDFDEFISYLKSLFSYLNKEIQGYRFHKDEEGYNLSGYYAYKRKYALNDILKNETN